MGRVEEEKEEGECVVERQAENVECLGILLGVSTGGGGLLARLFF
jgi:hypothetical protein